MISRSRWEQPVTTKHHELLESEWVPFSKAFDSSSNHLGINLIKVLNAGVVFVNVGKFEDSLNYEVEAQLDYTCLDKEDIVSSVPCLVDQLIWWVRDFSALFIKIKYFLDFPVLYDISILEYRLILTILLVVVFVELFPMQ